MNVGQLTHRFFSEGSKVKTWKFKNGEVGRGLAAVTVGEEDLSRSAVKFGDEVFLCLAKENFPTRDESGLILEARVASERKGKGKEEKLLVGLTLDEARRDHDVLVEVETRPSGVKPIPGRRVWGRVLVVSSAENVAVGRSGPWEHSLLRVQPGGALKVEVLLPDGKISSFAILNPDWSRENEWPDAMVMPWALYEAREKERAILVEQLAEATAKLGKAVERFATVAAPAAGPSSAEPPRTESAT